jgi:hypothetical protein
LKDIYLSGKIVLNNRKLEKLKQYLNEEKVIDLAGDEKLQKEKQILQEKQNKRNQRAMHHINVK